MRLEIRLEMLIAVGTITICNEFVSSNSWNLQRATFIPLIERRKINRCVIEDYHESPQGRRTFYRSHERTVTNMSKKKTAPAPVKKIQVKMLKYVEGTGHVGEIVMVTPPFYQNKLRPTASAIIITDEEVMKNKAEAEFSEKETRAKAVALKDRIVDLSISLRRKAGPDGHLFGGIGPKCIMDELDKSINDDFLKQKSIKITSITNEDGSDVNGDIKHTGTYKASLSLTNDIAGSFGIVVEAER